MAHKFVEGSETSEADKEFLSGEWKLTMWIPSELAGKVVGKKGVVISNIKMETGVSYIQALKSIGGSLWASVVIMGQTAKILAAYKAVAHIVDDEVDDVVAEYPFLRRKHHFLWGENRFLGAPIVQKVSATTNVRIFVPDKEAANPPPAGKMDPLYTPSFGTLEGSCENVFRAISMLDAAYADSLKQSWNTGSGAARDTRPAKSAAAAAVTATSSATAAPAVSIPVVVSEPPRSAVSAPMGKVKETGPKTAKPKPASLPSKERVQAAEATRESTAGDNIPKTPAVTFSSPPSIRAEENENKIQIAAAKSVSPEIAKDSNVALNVAETVASQPRNISETVVKTDHLVQDSATAVPRHTSSHSEAKIKTASERPVFDVVKRMTIPATLVGLLLARRPETRGSNRPIQKTVINTIQTFTKTAISRLTGPPPKRLPMDAVAGDVGNGRPVAKEESKSGGAAPEEGRRRRRPSCDEDGSSDSASDSDGFEDAMETPPAHGEADAGLSSSDVLPVVLDDVPFSIASDSEANVDYAIAVIQGIINGERIKDALIKLKERAEPDDDRHRFVRRGKDRFREDRDGRRDPRGGNAKRFSRDKPVLKDEQTAPGGEAEGTQSVEASAENGRASRPFRVGRTDRRPSDRKSGQEVETKRPSRTPEPGKSRGGRGAGRKGGRGDRSREEGPTGDRPAASGEAE